MGTGTPLAVYVVHHPACDASAELAKSMFTWLRLGDMEGDGASAGVPIYFRRALDGGRLAPGIDWDAAGLNVVIALVGHRVVGEPDWRAAVLDLASEAKDRRAQHPGRVLLLPVALHDAFYRTGPLYEHFNPVRLLGLEGPGREAALRRAVTEATTRALRGVAAGTAEPPPLDVFLSHAKGGDAEGGGQPIAEALRDGVRRFGQLVAWYDANDLPYGAAWESPMTRAAADGTAAMIATVTDRYPTRPWCRKEALLARTPRPLKGYSRIWTVQPVVVVHAPGARWSRGLPMLDGAPAIGWDPTGDDRTARVVDRLVLEALLVESHRQVARHLDARVPGDDLVLLTWVPDVWTLMALRDALARRRSRVRRVAFPGHGLRRAERVELDPVLRSFGATPPELVSFEEVWP